MAAVRLALAAAAAAAASAARPPNILFLMSDSMDGRVVDPTSPVSKLVATPALDDLARTGVNFIRTYAASPQCVPSRTSMLTGRRTDQIRTFTNGNGLAGDPSVPGGLDAQCVKDYDEEVCAHFASTQRVNSTFLDALRPAYDYGGSSLDGEHCRLCVFGKVDAGQNILTRFGPKPTADGWHGGPSLAILTRAADIRKPTKPDPEDITNDENNDVHPEDWRTNDACIAWLWAEKRRREQSDHQPSPWFLYCSLNIPHPPFQTNATWLASVDQQAVKNLPPKWKPVSALHPHDAYMTTSKGVARDFSAEMIFKVRRTYFAMVAETDYLIGQVVAAARASGMYDDTIVIFLSDHGEMNMEQRQVWKNSHFEASLRVPLIVSGGSNAAARLHRGSMVTTLTSLLDVYPTLLSIAGLPQPPAGDLAGSSLVPFLGWRDDSSQGRKPYVVSQFHSNTGNTGAFCVVHDRYKYIVFGHGFNQTYGSYAPQLFDLQADPHELIDIALSQPHIAANLDAMLRAELASGFNALSKSGDYHEIDVYVKWEQQQLYRRFFLNGVNLERQYERLLACELAKASNPLSRFLIADPELEGACVPTVTRASDDLDSLQAITDSKRRLRKLFEKQYRGFDDYDWAKVHAWAGADPLNSAVEAWSFPTY